MTFQRLSFNQIQIDLPLDAAREATWRAFVEARVSTPVIDRAQNIVQGTTGDGVLTAMRQSVARFEERPEGTLVSIESKAQMGGEFGGGKKQAKKLTDAVEAIFARTASSTNDAATNRSSTPVSFDKPIEIPVAAQMPLPIAAPTGPVRTGASGDPLYGVAGPGKRGSTILVYGLLGVTCCQIAAPFAVWYGIVSLKAYKEKGDPGDRGMVIAGLVLGILGCLVIPVRILLAVSNNGTGY